MEELLSKIKDIEKKVTYIRKQLELYSKLKNDINQSYKAEEVLTNVENMVLQVDGLQMDDLHEFIKRERMVVESHKRELRYRLAQQLEQRLSKLELTLKGQYPTLRAGLYTMKLDFIRGKVDIFWGPDKVATVDLNADSIVGEIEKLESLLKGEFDPANYMQLIAQAYMKVIKHKGLTPGDKIMLSELHQQLTIMMQSKAFWVNPIRRNLREYPRYRFAYDMYRVMRKYGDRIQLTVATFDATKDPEKAIWIPDNDEKGTRYSYVVVRC